MSIYRRPAFWAIFIMWQVFAFLMTACLATGCYLFVTALWGLRAWPGSIIDNRIAPILHLILAVFGFLLAKRRMQMPSQSPGFPVIQRNR